MTDTTRAAAGVTSPGEVDEPTLGLTPSPTVGPSPLRRLKTPAGSPASSTTSASRKALSGATSDGLTTTVHPAARAGATLAAIWASG